MTKKSSGSSSQENCIMSISAFFHQETPLHPYFNTIPDSYHLSAPSRKYFSTHEVPPLSPQTVDQSQYSSLDPIVEDASTLISVTTPLVSSQPRRDQEDAQSSAAGVPIPSIPAPIPSLPQSSVEEESGYSSVIIPNTIDDFLATHQVFYTSVHLKYLNCFVSRPFYFLGLNLTSVLTSLSFSASR